MKTMKLEGHHKHTIRLIGRDSGADGWAPVSEQLFPVLEESMPAELVTFERQD